ncbi:SGNH/GDSL hydrolase family protein [Actinomadura fulvescens]|uniref:SGNH hydrolase-type esterase domain-containing protein n=1 Tax=Actinomadura fulvescens TaxID=46160 RepID=A0ABN3PAQ3_9ACTN
MTNPESLVPADGDYAKEEADEYHLTLAEADRLLEKAPWRRFAVMGDSLAEGLGEESPGYRSVTWSDRTREALTRHVPDLAFLNVGLRDLIASEVREQQLGRVLEFRPDLVALVAGGNDLFRADFDPAKVEAELDQIVGPLRAAGADVVTFALMNISAAIPEVAALKPNMELLNERIRAVSARHGALLVDMWNHPGCASRDMFSSDLMHSSMRGHALLGAETIRRLGVYLASR